MPDAPQTKVPSLLKRRHLVVDSVVKVDEEPPAGETRALKRAAPAAPARAAERPEELLMCPVLLKRRFLLCLNGATAWWTRSCRWMRSLLPGRLER